MNQLRHPLGTDKIQVVMKIVTWRKNFDNSFSCDMTIIMMTTTFLKTANTISRSHKVVHQEANCYHTYFTLYPSIIISTPTRCG